MEEVIISKSNNEKYTQQLWTNTAKFEIGKSRSTTLASWGHKEVSSSFPPLIHSFRSLIQKYQSQTLNNTLISQIQWAKFETGKSRSITLASSPQWTFRLFCLILIHFQITHPCAQYFSKLVKCICPEQLSVFLTEWLQYFCYRRDVGVGILARLRWSRQ